MAEEREAKPVFGSHLGLTIPMHADFREVVSLKLELFCSGRSGTLGGFIPELDWQFEGYLLVFSISKQIQSLYILELATFTLPGNLKGMTNREQLIQELEQAPDDLVQTVLDFLYRVKAIRKRHPLAKFAGILSDLEAEELQRAVVTECRQVDLNEW